MSNAIGLQIDTSSSRRSDQRVRPTRDVSLISLQTKAEVDVKCEFAEAFIVQVQAKSTAIVLRFVSELKINLINIPDT